MQEQRDCCFDSLKKIVSSMQPKQDGVSMQRDCCLDTDITKGIVRCSHNEIVDLMQPQEGA